MNYHLPYFAPIDKPNAISNRPNFISPLKLLPTQIKDKRGQIYIFTMCMLPTLYYRYKSHQNYTNKKTYIVGTSQLSSDGCSLGSDIFRNPWLWRRAIWLTFPSSCASSRRSRLCLRRPFLPGYLRSSCFFATIYALLPNEY